MKNKLQKKVIFTFEPSSKSITDLQKNHIQYEIYKLITVKHLALAANRFRTLREISPYWVITSMHATSEFIRNAEELNIDDIKLYTFSSKVYNKISPVYNNIVKLEEDSADNLFSYLTSKCPRQKFVFLCGNRSRTLISEQFMHYIQFEEVYHTNFEMVDLPKNIDAIALISPSAVESFMKQTKSFDSKIPIFTLGNTTATIIRKKFTNQVFISKKQTTDSLIQLVIKYFNAL